MENSTLLVNTRFWIEGEQPGSRFMDITLNILDPQNEIESFSIRATALGDVKAHLFQFFNKPELSNWWSSRRASSRVYISKMT
jgi:hypothetical protein